MVGCCVICMQMVLLCSFIVVYIHTFRGLYYASYLYPKEHLWSVGVVIMLLMILLPLWDMFCLGDKCLFGEQL